MSHEDISDDDEEIKSSDIEKFRNLVGIKQPVQENCIYIYKIIIYKQKMMF